MFNKSHNLYIKSYKEESPNKKENPNKKIKTKINPVNLGNTIISPNSNNELTDKQIIYRHKNPQFSGRK